MQPLNSDGTPQVDGNGNPVLTSRTETYGYDELSRLTSVNYGDGETQGYAFDAMGNRLSKTDNSTTENYTYNAANMMLTRGSSSYTNDADGNTLTGGGRTNVWDSQNRLVSCSFNGNTSSYVYGSDGYRHRSVVNGTTTDFALDGDNVLREGTATGGVFTPTATYLMGGAGPLYRRSDTTSTVRWYVADGLGSVVGEVDPSGTLTSNRGCDVYGAVRSSSGTATSRHGFCGTLGHTSEDETGLVYMRARYMDPQVGRFVSEDPGRSGVNWFAYASANPANACDLTGRDLFTDVVAHLIADFLKTLLRPFTNAVGQRAFYWGAQLVYDGQLVMAGGEAQAALGAGTEMSADLEDAAFDGFPAMLPAAIAGAGETMCGVDNVIRGAAMIFAGNLIMALGTGVQDL